ncbi:hypothetical protein SAMD00019534_074420, partial [Acytostelium subglobosum LB1]|uniref:hypothetical protein n=1 Tax=Acytostelium subglobosum LB1 TaxID=1410327 RepID=UPI000644998A
MGFVRLLSMRLCTSQHITQHNITSIIIMCGISFIINGVNVLDPLNSASSNQQHVGDKEEDDTLLLSDTQSLLDDLIVRLTNRGPDSVIQQSKTIKTIGQSGQRPPIHITMVASVLGMRGELTVQPCQDDRGNILMWNGELFDGYDIGVHDNDTRLLLHLFNQADIGGGGSGIDPSTFVNIMLKIKMWMEWAKPIVYQLSYPAITIMDMTISLALWFAARGEGLVHGREQEYGRVMTTCKVLLMGSGADEQLAGYGRHRSAFARGSWQVLQGELNKDFNRIWKRNLGRDDRVISSNRREPRFPYLDENVIEYLNSVPLSYVCDLSLAQGTGDKRILRELAKTLGLTASTCLIKKAIQFGSRSSKQLNKNVPARITQKCGVQTFSFSRPLYQPELEGGSGNAGANKTTANKKKDRSKITKPSSPTQPTPIAPIGDVVGTNTSSSSSSGHGQVGSTAVPPHQPTTQSHK